MISTHRYCKAVGKLEKLVVVLVNEFLVAFSVRSETGNTRSSRLEMPVFDSDLHNIHPNMSKVSTSIGSALLFHKSLPSTYKYSSATRLVNVSAPTELREFPCSKSVCNSSNSGQGVAADSVVIKFELKSKCLSRLGKLKPVKSVMKLLASSLLTERNSQYQSADC